MKLNRRLWQEGTSIRRWTFRLGFASLYVSYLFWLGACGAKGGNVRSAVHTQCKTSWGTYADLESAYCKTCVDKATGDPFPLSSCSDSVCVPPGVKRANYNIESFDKTRKATTQTLAHVAQKICKGKDCKLSSLTSNAQASVANGSNSASPKLNKPEELNLPDLTQNGGGTSGAEESAFGGSLGSGLGGDLVTTTSKGNQNEAIEPTGEGSLAVMSGGSSGMAAKKNKGADGDFDLSSMFGGGRDPASMGAASALGFGGTDSDLNPQGSDDPRDYFGRINPYDSLFQIVERRYRKTWGDWELQRARQKVGN